MIDTHEKFRMQGVGESDKEFFMEVNWDPEDKVSNQCKIIRVTFPDGKKTHIKKEQLLAFLFAIGDAAEQRELLPARLTKVRKYHTVLTVKAGKDMKKGESLNFPYSFEVPIGEDEVIGKTEKYKNSLIQL